MARIVVCAECKSPLPVQVGRGRPRVKCANCSKNKPRPNPAVVNLPPPLVDEPERPLERAVRAELEAYGRVDSPDGAAALYAARMLEAGQHSGASAASLLRELRASVSAATKGASTGADLVDELRAKRDKRRGA